MPTPFLTHRLKKAEASGPGALPKRNKNCYFFLAFRTTFFLGAAFFVTTFFFGLGFGFGFGLSLAAHSMHNLPFGLEVRTAQSALVFTFLGTLEQAGFE
jgi:hypothetical protein